MPAYEPPLTLTPDIASRVADIAERVGRVSLWWEGEAALRLRRVNRVRTVAGTLAIEGNGLSEAQVTAILEGQRVLAPAREIQEVHNALAAYEALPDWKPASEADLLAAHAMLMRGLAEHAGRYRAGAVGVVGQGQVLYAAPQAKRVPRLMADLLHWLEGTDLHPLIAGCVFHFEFEFIHPFSDGNGRLGRLWQTLVLSRWQPWFVHLPVENLVHRHQSAYYQAIAESTKAADTAPFVAFMLGVIGDALVAMVVSESAPQDTPQDTPQVHGPVNAQIAALLKALVGMMSREQLQAALDLKDRKSFRERYLRPALAAGWVEMTLPDKPNSRLQRYRLTTSGLQIRGQIEAGEILP